MFEFKKYLKIRILWTRISDLTQSEVLWTTVGIRMKISINMQTFYSMKPWFQLKALNTKSFKTVNKRKKTSISVIVVTRYFCTGQNRCSLLKLIISRIATERGNTQRCKWVYDIVCLLLKSKKKIRLLMITFIMHLEKRLEHMFWITVILKPSQTLAWWVVKCSMIKNK